MTDSSPVSGCPSSVIFNAPNKDKERCGILNPNRLAAFYEQAVARSGGRFFS